jgi:transposase
LSESLTLADRVFHCENCGFTADRDLNAALNLANYPRLVGKERLGRGEHWRA